MLFIKMELYNIYHCMAPLAHSALCQDTFPGKLGETKIIIFNCYIRFQWMDSQ